MIHISKAERKILDAILKGYPPCYVFGSRVKGTHKPFSDLDLCFKGEGRIPDRIIAELGEKFENSDLPFKVDIIDYYAVDANFRAILSKQMVALGD